MESKRDMGDFCIHIPLGIRGFVMDGLVALGISKQFIGVKALDNVDFDLIPGEIHAIVGENGAGKSTLVKILGGLLRPTAGTIQLNGRKVHFDSPQQAQAAGISVIAQEFNLVPQLSVAENLFLGHEPRRKGGLIDWGTINRRSASLLQELGVNISPRQRLEYLSVADKQHVEIAKALSREFRFIIMDEPTAVLNEAEVKQLFAIIRAICQRGLSVLYVSHRLSEIFRIADRVTVLRDGRKVGTRAIKELTESEVITMMLGHALKDYVIKRVEVLHIEAPALSVRNLSVGRALFGVSFDLHYGEVLGCAGLVGSGRYELMRAIVGLIPHTGGEIQVNGHQVWFRNISEAMNAGIFMLPEDRKVEGVFPHLSVLENTVINIRRSEKRFHTLILDQKFEGGMYKKAHDFLAIRAYSPSQIITTLSGGNQQKVMLGRALVAQSRILLLNEPSRGVDVGTKAEIRSLIRRLADEGCAILVNSSDIPDLVSFSDHCLVLSAGRVCGLLSGKEITADSIIASAVAVRQVVEANV